MNLSGLDTLLDPFSLTLTPIPVRPERSEAESKDALQRLWGWGRASVQAYPLKSRKAEDSRHRQALGGLQVVKHFGEPCRQCLYMRRHVLVRD